MTIDDKDKVTVRALKQFIFVDDNDNYRYVYINEEVEVNYQKAYNLYTTGFIDVLNPLYNDDIVQTNGYKSFLNLLKKKEGAL